MHAPLPNPPSDGAVVLHELIYYYYYYYYYLIFHESLINYYYYYYFASVHAEIHIAPGVPTIASGLPHMFIRKFINQRHSGILI